jgi:hypothetical protein
LKLLKSLPAPLLFDCAHPISVYGSPKRKVVAQVSPSVLGTEVGVKQFIITVSGVFLGLLLFFVVIPLVLIASAAGSSAPVTPPNTVLSVDLRDALTDVPASTPFAAFSGSSSVVSLVRKLEAAETDANVKGILVRASEGGLAPAHAEEIRQAQSQRQICHRSRSGL